MSQMGKALHQIDKSREEALAILFKKHNDIERILDEGPISVGDVMLLRACTEYVAGIISQKKAEIVALELGEPL